MSATNNANEGSDALKDFFIQKDKLELEWYDKLIEQEIDYDELLESSEKDLQRMLENDCKLPSKAVRRITNAVRKIPQSTMYKAMSITNITVISAEEDNAMENLKNSTLKLTNMSINIESTLEKLTDNFTNAKDTINRNFDTVIENANHRRNKLLKTLDNITKLKQNKLQNQHNIVKHKTKALNEWNVQIQQMIKDTSLNKEQRKGKIVSNTAQMLSDTESGHDYNKLGSNHIINVSVDIDIINGLLSHLGNINTGHKNEQKYDIEDVNDVISENLQNQLLALICDAPKLDTNNVLTVFKSYNELCDFSLFDTVLKQCIIQALIIKCAQIICKHMGLENNSDRKCFEIAHDIKINEYKNLCTKVKPRTFPNCFIDICGRVFDVLYSYHKIEELLVKFRTENDIIIEKQNTQVIRNDIWYETETILGYFLRLSSTSIETLTELKIEDLSLALDSVSVIETIAANFSGSKRKILSQLMEQKCLSYLHHFKSTFWESIKTNFDSDMWVVLPIPSDFGIHSISELQPITKRALQFSHKQFLNGDNIFDDLNELTPINEESEPLMPNSAEQKATNVMSEPCITSTSLNLVKFIGKCLQISETLPPISHEVFMTIADSFNLYFYHIFVWFGVNVHNFFDMQESEFIGAFDKIKNQSMKDKVKDRVKHKTDKLIHRRSNSITEKERQIKITAHAQKVYPILQNIINQINEALRQRKLAPELEDLISKTNAKTQRPNRLPHYAKCYMSASQNLQLCSNETMQGVASRFVATETLPFVVYVIKSQSQRLVCLSSKYEYTNEVTQFMARINNVIGEFKKYMYRNVPLLLVHLGHSKDKNSIISHLNSTKWNVKKIQNVCNGYVNELIEIFVKIEIVLHSFPTLPNFIHFRLNKEAIMYVEEQLVEAYAKCKKCTCEGRAMMTLDVNTLSKSYPINKYNHSWQYTNAFIKAYYLEKNELLKFVKAHTQYSLKIHKSFARIGQNMQYLKRNEKMKFEKEIEKAYYSGKGKQFNDGIDMEQKTNDLTVEKNSERETDIIETDNGNNNSNVGIIKQNSNNDIDVVNDNSNDDYLP